MRTPADPECFSDGNIAFLLYIFLSLLTFSLLSSLLKSFSNSTTSLLDLEFGGDLIRFRAIATTPSVGGLQDRRLSFFSLLSDGGLDGWLHLHFAFLHTHTHRTHHGEPNRLRQTCTYSRREEDMRNERRRPLSEGRDRAR